MGKRQQCLSISLWEWQQQAVSSLPGAWLLAFWSFLEAICWFILPDYLLFLMVVLCPSQAKRLVVISWTGSILGCLVMVGFMVILPKETADLIFNLPFTSKAMLDQVQYLGQVYGLTSVLWQPVSGIPAKVWTYAAIENFHWQPLAFCGLLAVARGMRMMVVAAVGCVIERYLTNVLQNHWLIYQILYTVLFLLLFNKISS